MVLAKLPDFETVSKKKKNPPGKGGEETWRAA
jgi:hypothetical protein